MQDDNQKQNVTITPVQLKQLGEVLQQSQTEKPPATSNLNSFDLQFDKILLK